MASSDTTKSFVVVVVIYLFLFIYSFILMVTEYIDVICHGSKRLKIIFWLDVFYGISTLVGYLMPNPVYIYIYIYIYIAGNSVSSTGNDINMRLTKVWTAIDRLSII